jgi:hypothetical protein
MAQWFLSLPDILVIMWFFCSVILYFSGIILSRKYGWGWIICSVIAVSMLLVSMDAYLLAKGENNLVSAVIGVCLVMVAVSQGLKNSGI